MLDVRVRWRDRAMKAGWRRGAGWSQRWTDVGDSWGRNQNERFENSLTTNAREHHGSRFEVSPPIGRWVCFPDSCVGLALHVTTNNGKCNWKDELSRHEVGTGLATQGEQWSAAFNWFPFPSDEGHRETRHRVVSLYLNEFFHRARGSRSVCREPITTEHRVERSCCLTHGCYKRKVLLDLKHQ